MLKHGVKLEDCFKTPRRFLVPNLKGEELNTTTTELHDILLHCLNAYNQANPEGQIRWGAISRTENNRHLVCSLAAPKTVHGALEDYLTKNTETAVKVKENLEDGKKTGTFRVVLDIGQFYYFLQPRQLTEAQLEEAGIRKEDCRVRPGTKEFWVPQFGSRKRMNSEEMRTYLIDSGLTGENPDLAMMVAYSDMVPLGERQRYAALTEQLETLGLPTVDTLRHFAATPDIYLPKIDEASLVGTEQEMLAARKAIKREMAKHKPGSEMYKKLDSQQLALKVLCNSLYGATGVKVGKLAGMHISATVTAEGKRSILECSEEVGKKFGGDTQGGDTDSIFTHFPSIQRLDQIYEPINYIDDVTGEMIDTTRIDQIVDFANTLVPPPMKIEFEKAYENYFVPASADNSDEAPKKRAAFVEYMPFWDSIDKCMKFDGKGKIGFKGLETKRRDSCLIAQETIKGFITRLLSVGPDKSEEDAFAEAAAFAREKVEKVMNGDVPFHQLIQARQLSKKNYASKMPHVEICEKKRQRGEPVPELGSRIPFVVVTGSKGRKFYESVEDPDYALEHNMQLDYMYVIEKKIAAPIRRFTRNMPNTEALDNTIFGNLRKRHRRNLRDDDPLAAFVQELHPCAECGESSPQLVCSNCGPNASWQDMWGREVLKRQLIDEQLDTAMRTCRSCMAIGDEEDVDCSNMTCAEYFPRRDSFFEQKRQNQRLDDIQKLHVAYGVDLMDLDW